MIGDYHQVGERTQITAVERAAVLVGVSDLVAFLFHRLRTKSDTDPRAVRANDRLWTHLTEQDTLHGVHVWEPGLEPPARTKTPRTGGV